MTLLDYHCPHENRLMMFFSKLQVGYGINCSFVKKI
jgi:hypothetical protein